MAYEAANYLANIENMDKKLEIEEMFANGPQIARSKMPQIDSEFSDNVLIHFAKKYKVQKVKMKVTDLKPSQSEYDFGKVKQHVANGSDWNDKPFLLAGKNNLLDGHHRAVQGMMTEPDTDVTAYKLGMPLERAIKILNRLKFSYRELDDGTKHGGLPDAVESVLEETKGVLTEDIEWFVTEKWTAGDLKYSLENSTSNPKAIGKIKAVKGKKNTFSIITTSYFKQKEIQSAIDNAGIKGEVTDFESYKDTGRNDNYATIVINEALITEKAKEHKLDKSDQSKLLKTFSVGDKVKFSVKWGKGPSDSKVTLQYGPSSMSFVLPYGVEMPDDGRAVVTKDGISINESINEGKVSVEWKEYERPSDGFAKGSVIYEDIKDVTFTWSAKDKVGIADFSKEQIEKKVSKEQFTTDIVRVVESIRGDISESGAKFMKTKLGYK